MLYTVQRMPIESPSIVAGLAMERCVGRGIPAHSRACFDAIDVLGTGPDRLDGVDKDQMLYFNIMRVRFVFLSCFFVVWLFQTSSALGVIDS